MNRTLAEHRAARAVELSLAGMTYQDIADELGYRDRSGPWRAVRRCLARRQQVAADQFVGGLLADLQIIEERVWPQAARGDVSAGHAMLRVIEARMRLASLLSTQGGQRGEDAMAEQGNATPQRSARSEPGEGELGVFGSFAV